MCNMCIYISIYLYICIYVYTQPEYGRQEKFMDMYIKTHVYEDTCI